MDDSQEEMNADEIYRICEIAKNIGVRNKDLVESL